MNSTTIGQIGKYRILSRIGRGGMGTVYKAFDPALDRAVALKAISADIEMTDDARARFLLEAQACARLGHPNIVTIYDLGEADGHLFIVMELLEGEELRQLIATRPVLHLKEKLTVILQLCDGLDYAHRKGIIHRDIKPANLFIRSTGQLKILDFGIARIDTGSITRTRTGLLVGTPQYMAPERLRGHHGDHRSDVFSVGAVLYELLTYRSPFGGDNPFEILEQLRTADPAPPTTIDPMLPPELDAIVAKALEKDPASRCETLGAMRDALAPVLQRAIADADRIRRDVGTALREVNELQDALARSIGGPWREPPVTLDADTPFARIDALRREAGVKVERLRGLVALATELEPVFERGLDAIARGDCDAAIAELEPVVARMPEHARAAAGIEQARARLGERAEVDEPPHVAVDGNQASEIPIPPSPSALTVSAPDRVVTAPSRATRRGTVVRWGAGAAAVVSVAIAAVLLTWVREPRPVIAPPPPPPATVVSHNPERPPGPAQFIQPPAVQNVQPEPPPTIAKSSEGAGAVPPTIAVDAGSRPRLPTEPSQDRTPGPPPATSPSAGPQEKRPDVETEIRGVLARYVQAIERKDLNSLRLVRPGLKDNERERFARWFEVTRSQKVNLTVHDVRVTGDQATVTGRREDRVVMKNDQTIHENVRFLYTLVRRDRGWVIHELNQTSDARDDRTRRSN